MQATAVILAAGLGTRMKSALPKTLHRIAGRSMLRHLLGSCEQVFDRIVVVVGPDMEAVQREAQERHRAKDGQVGLNHFEPKVAIRATEVVDENRACQHQ